MSLLPPETPDNIRADHRDSEPASFSALSLFLGRDGLRPVWGLALFLFFWTLLRQFLFPLSEALFSLHASSLKSIAPQEEYAIEGASFLCIAGATWLMARLERRRVANFGLNPHRGIRLFLSGLGWGIALLSLLVLLLRLSGLLLFDARLLFGANILRFAFIWGAGFLLVGLAEEMLLRGYLQFTLTRLFNSLLHRRLGYISAQRASFWIAALVLSIFFAYGHSSNPGESPIGLCNAALIGLVFCFSLWRTDSLWWAIGFHAAWDWAQSFLFGVADSGLMVQGHLLASQPLGRPILSGGLTGPEGSLLLLPVAAIACAAIGLTLPRVSSAVAPDNPPLH